MDQHSEINCELPLLAEFNYTPGTPDVMYLSNGDPGYPGEPPELELTACWLVQGAKRINIFSMLSEEQVTAIEEDLMENWEDPGEDEGDYEGDDEQNT